MVMSVGALRDAVGQLRNARNQEQSRLHRIDRHLHGSLTGRAAGVFVPERVTREFRILVEQARYNVLELVVTAVAQNLYVDGYRASDPVTGRAQGLENADIWNRVWQPNRMDARQAGLFRAAISYGVSYSTVLPGGVPGVEEESVPEITPYSPLRLTALYEDRVNDEWPVVAMIAGDTTNRFELYDDEGVYDIEVEDEGTDGLAVRLLRFEEHGLEVTPVVRYLDRFDLTGAPPGKIEPLIPLQQQLNQTTFSLLMAQQYGAFRQRWVTGMEIETTESGQPKSPFNIQIDTLLQSDSPNTTFGEFEQTDLSGYLDSREKALMHVAAVAQIPVYSFPLGSGISNISAEAVVALDNAHQRDIGEHQTSFGESMEQTLRLSGKAIGDEAGMRAWEDTSAQVVWRDTTPRSLAQIADALGKLKTLLDIPAQALWPRVPGVTNQEIEQWKALAENQDLERSINELLGEETDAQPTSAPGDSPIPT